MKVAFLYPPDDPHDALVGWVHALARHCKRHEVVHARDGHCRAWADVILLLTHGETHPRALCDLHIREAREFGVPVGVVHNWDTPGVPTPGDYPSFCWTQRALGNLGALYQPLTLVRQPVFPPVVPTHEGDDLLVATFGSIEPKKRMATMFRWARDREIPFRVYGPKELTELYGDYIGFLYGDGCPVHLYDWTEKVEDLAPLFQEVSHFLFVLPPSKDGTGGSPTNPRYAGFFNRPVIVVDDEDTCDRDGFYVYKSLEGIEREHLSGMKPPRLGLSPDEYVETLVWETLAYWEGK